MGFIYADWSAWGGGGGGGGLGAWDDSKTSKLKPTGIETRAYHSPANQ